MSRYDGLIIPRSYSDYINKTDAATLQQALQLPGVLSAIVAAGDNKAVKSSAIYEALNNYINKTDADTLQQALQLPGVLSGAVAAGDNKAVTSNAVYGALTDAATIQQALQLSGVLSGSVAAGDNKAVKSSAVNTALGAYYNKQSVDNKLNGKLDKSILNGNQFYMEYATNLTDYELPSSGNGFIFRLFNNIGFEYIQIAISPLSNDYSIWKPTLIIQIRVRNPNGNAWSAWKVLNSVNM